MRLILLITISFLFSIFTSKIVQATDGCEEGISSSWIFNPKSYVISLDAAFQREVCYLTPEEEDANFEIRLLKGDKIVYSTKIFWDAIILGDVMDNKTKKLRAVASKGDSYKLMKFPVKISQVDRYQVLDISSGKTVGSGKVAETKAE